MIVPARTEASRLRAVFGVAKSSPYYLTGNSDSITQNPPCCNSALKNNLFWSSVYPKVTVLLGFNFELQHLESIIQSLISSGFPPALMLHAGSLGSVVQATLQYNSLYFSECRAPSFFPTTEACVCFNH